MTKTNLIATGLLCVIGALTNAKAELLAYEPFNYTAGTSLIGQNLGHGFVNPWTAGGNVNNSIIRSGSFTYTDTFGNSILNLGNRALITGDGSAAGDNTGGNNAGASPRRTLNFTRGTGASPSTTWISLIATRTGPAYPYINSLGHTVNYGRGVGALQFFYNAAAPGNLTQGNEILSIGRGSANSGEDPALLHDSWALVNRGAAAQEAVSFSGFAALPPDFLLLRIDHAVGTAPHTNPSEADTAYLWINPTSLAFAPTLNSADVVFSPTAIDPTNDRDYVFNVLRLFGGSFNTTVGYSAVEVDEIKVGTAFLDVTLNAVPEPSMIALLGVGALLFVVARRRK